MHWVNDSLFLVADCVDQIDDGEDRDEGSENEFRLIEKVSWDVSVTAAFDVINL